MYLVLDPKVGISVGVLKVISVHLKLVIFHVFSVQLVTAPNQATTKALDPSTGFVAPMFLAFVFFVTMSMFHKPRQQVLLFLGISFASTDVFEHLDIFRDVLGVLFQEVNGIGSILIKALVFEIAFLSISHLLEQIDGRHERIDVLFFVLRHPKVQLLEHRCNVATEHNDSEENHNDGRGEDFASVLILKVLTGLQGEHKCNGTAESGEPHRELLLWADLLSDELIHKPTEWINIAYAGE